MAAIDDLKNSVGNLTNAFGTLSANVTTAIQNAGGVNDAEIATVVGELNGLANQMTTLADQLVTK